MADTIDANFAVIEMVEQQSRRVSSDILFAYAAVAAHLGALVLVIFVGFHLTLGFALFLLIPILIWAALSLTSQISAGKSALSRALPLTLTLLCLAGYLFRTTSVCGELHIMRLIYLAGGPHTLNTWAQKHIEANDGRNEIVDIEGENDVPIQIRKSLPGWYSVHGSPDGIPLTLRIELGGGFHHYGVIVVPTSQATAPTWIHKQINWPTEVLIYNGD